MKINSVISYQLSVICIAAATVIVFGSCSKLENNALSPVQLQSQSGIYPHPSGWADTTSSNFHGTYFINTYVNTQTFDLTSCATCHASDLKGGTTKFPATTVTKGMPAPWRATRVTALFESAPPKEFCRVIYWP